MAAPVVADIHLIGLASARPAASSHNDGFYYTETDTNGGTLFRSNGTTWVQQAKGVTLIAADIPSLDAAKITTGVLGIGRLATGTPTGTKFVRDDGTLQVPAGSGDMLTSTYDPDTNGIIDVAQGGTNASTAAAARANLGVAVYNDAGNSSTAITINWATAHVQKVTMTGNCTFTFTNPVAGDVYVLQLLQDGTGSRTATWPGSVKWSGGTAPTLTTTAAKTDVLTFLHDGTNFFGVVSGLNY